MKQEDDILIEKYLLGKLSETEKEAFEKRMSSDEAFKESVLLEEQLFDALDENSWSTSKGLQADEYRSVLDSKDIKDLKKMLSETTNTYQENVKPQYPFKKVLTYAIAAAVTLFIAFQFLVPQTYTPQELYAQCNAYDDLPSFVTRADSDESKLVRAQELFDQKQYKQAIPLFDNELLQNKNDSRIYIYLGLSYVESGDYNNAIKIFDSLSESDLIDAEMGYWYKALTFLKQGDVKKSKSILENIVNKKFYNFEKAKSLLKEL